jgi:hypothetical protein
VFLHWHNLSCSCQNIFKNMSKPYRLICPRASLLATGRKVISNARKCNPCSMKLVLHRIMWNSCMTWLPDVVTCWLALRLVESSKGPSIFFIIIIIITSVQSVVKTRRTLCRIIKNDDLFLKCVVSSMQKCVVALHSV